MRGALLAAGTAVGLLGGLAGFAVAAGQDPAPAPNGPAVIELSARPDPDLPGGQFHRNLRRLCGSDSTNLCTPRAGSGLTVHQVQDIGAKATAAPTTP